MEDERLRWQSRGILLVVLPLVALFVMEESGFWWNRSPEILAQTWLVVVLFTAAVRLLRAATMAGALLGGLLTGSMVLSTLLVPYSLLRTALLPLLSLFVLTWAATRFRRSQKEALHLAEGRRGRQASQVAANLGAASLAFLYKGWPTAGMALLAALCEATADTLASEIGTAVGGTPRLLLGWREVPVGTDGAVSLAGTLAGSAGSVAVATVGAWALRLPFPEAAFAAAAGLIGFFLDTLLGATLERKHWLNNDLVNFLSSATAAGLGALGGAILQRGV